ncbi:hypothetical protein TRAPUB_9606 [Trametes pubescens]|uniref:F-box domain-containing protein n=1 Tax=Trametes pubescens TaxID=154538 RepID=A0A1M2W200_TRAPU|nr:hypothetical protein TRAPUB_9606 [Trametes pubescens]
MSAGSRLPEELLDVILHQVLTLPSSTFLKWSDENTYSCTPTSTAANLLFVNKTWARIGQAHLYEGIILRRSQQATTLARTLKADAKRKKRAGSGPALAEHIRRLRIDRVQNKAVATILRAATNVEALHLHAEMPSNAPLIDWLGAFKQISPQRVYLDLVERDFPGRTDEYLNRRLVTDAVESVLAPAPGGGMSSAFWGKVREVHRKRYWYTTSHYATAKGVIKITRRDLDLSKACMPSLVKRTYWPMATDFPPAGCLPDSVWSHIFSFAMLGHGLGEWNREEGPRFRQIRLPASLRPRRPNIELLLVSKWFKKMAEPLLYSKPTLNSDRAVQLFGESLYNRPELAKHVRELMTSPESTIDSLLSGARTNNGFRPIPWVLPNLRASGGVLFASISPERQLMLHRPPPSLVTLLLQCQSHCQCGADRCGQQCVQGRFCLDGSVFNNLPHLEHLSICGCIVREPQDTLSVSHALPRLKRIHLRLHPGQNWAVQCLSLMQLPALETLLLRMHAFRDIAPRVVPDFLAVHGQKLRHIDFEGTLRPQDWKVPLLDYCPNVESLEVDASDKIDASIDVIRCSRPHHHLKFLSIARPDDRHEDRHVHKKTDTWKRVLLAIDFTPFVVLEELRLALHDLSSNARIAWPDSEAAAKGSHWPALIAELQKRCPTMSVSKEGNHKWGRAVTPKKTKGKQPAKKTNVNRPGL